MRFILLRLLSLILTLSSSFLLLRSSFHRILVFHRHIRKIRTIRVLERELIPEEIMHFLRPWAVPVWWWCLVILCTLPQCVKARVLEGNHEGEGEFAVVSACAGVLV